MEVLKQLEYIRRDVSPNRSAYGQGIYMPVYFAVGPTNWYPYGESDYAEGYIAPHRDIDNLRKIARMIGYSGTVVLS